MKDQRKIPKKVLCDRAAKMPLSKVDLSRIEKAWEYGRLLHEEYKVSAFLGFLDANIEGNVKPISRDLLDRIEALRLSADENMELRPGSGNARG